jgi:hypothetical protein
MKINSKLFGNKSEVIALTAMIQHMEAIKLELRMEQIILILIRQHFLFQ